MSSVERSRTRRRDAHVLVRISPVTVHPHAFQIGATEQVHPDHPVVRDVLREQLAGAIARGGVVRLCAAATGSGGVVQGGCVHTVRRQLRAGIGKCHRVAMDACRPLATPATRLAHEMRLESQVARHVENRAIAVHRSCHSKRLDGVLRRAWKHYVVLQGLCAPLLVRV